MKKKINKRLMGTAALAIVMTLLLMVAVCYNLSKKQIFEELKFEAKIINYTVIKDTVPTDEKDTINRFNESMGGYAEEFLAELTRENIRITFINAGGDVVYDTQADYLSMDNHSGRPEAKQALEEGEGMDIRKSDTLGQSTYYYAMRISDGSILRLSKDADSIYKIMGAAIPYIVLILLTILFVCFTVSYFMSVGLMRPIKMIAENVEQLETIEAYEEMQPFINAIKNRNDDVLQNARMRQEFTANVSHELKTPLTAISGYSELIENGMVSSEAETRRFAKEINSNSQRLLTLINDVIRLSELDASEMEEIFETVNLKDIAENCVSMLQINAEKHNVTLTLEGESVTIMSTKQMLEEVLFNLCDNAIRYNKEGGSVIVTVKDRLNTAVLTIKDTGIGIPKEHHERIFERFYRVDKSRSKLTGGTGLGLAIVKHILVKLKGELSLCSEAGKGTEITIVFPAERNTPFKR